MDTFLCYAECVLRRCRRWNNPTGKKILNAYIATSNRRKEEALMGKRKREESLGITEPLHRKSFALVDVGILNDRRLSWRAKGVLIYLSSKVDGEEKVTYDSLLDASSEGEETLLAIFQELIQAGYALPDIVMRLKKNNHP